MSASELATVIEGWATLAGLFVVIAGAVFAGVQLRQEAQAKRLQALLALYSEIRPPEVTRAQQLVLGLPDGFDMGELSQAERDAVYVVLASNSRAGLLLAEGFVQKEDLLLNPALSVGALRAWEKLKHIARQIEQLPEAEDMDVGKGFPTTSYFELLAASAQEHLLRNGVRQYARVPRFEADIDALRSVARDIATARAAAS